jgi:ribosomal protein S18 acetylase RimI-like enzyme
VHEVAEDGFQQHLENDDISNYLIDVNGETIGFVTLRIGTHPSRTYTRYTHMVNLFVEAKYRSQGYGSEVVEQVKELAQENDCDHLKVSCEWHNEGARRFYEDAGFEEKQVTFVQTLE